MTSLKDFQSYVESSGVSFDELSKAEKREWRESFDKSRVKNAVNYSTWPFFSSWLEKFGLSTASEQYLLYGSVMVAVMASRKPVMQAYWMNKYLHETDESMKKMIAGRGKFSQVELNAGVEYLKEMRRIPRRWAVLPISFVVVEGLRIAFKRVFRAKSTQH